MWIADGGGLFGEFSGTLQQISKRLPTHYFVQPGWDLLQGKEPAGRDVAVLAGYTAALTAISAVLQRWSFDPEGGMRKVSKSVRWVAVGFVLLWFLFSHHII